MVEVVPMSSPTTQDATLIAILPFLAAASRRFAQVLPKLSLPVRNAVGSIGAQSSRGPSDTPGLMSDRERQPWATGSNGSSATASR